MPTMPQPMAPTRAAEALDWANDLAAAIIADVHARRYTEAESLIAARLRLVKQQGSLEGATRLSEALAQCSDIAKATGRAS